MPKRLISVPLASVAALGLTVAGAAAVGAELPIQGEAELCLTPEATESLDREGITMAGTGDAKTAGDCVTLPGSGKVTIDLVSGELAFEGGLRFADAHHRLDVTNLRAHVKDRTTTADVSVDGGPATNVDFFYYEITSSNVSVKFPAAETKGMGLRLTQPNATAFDQAFGTSPVTVGSDLFTMEATARFTNPLG
jgi:hypothetical protein